MENKNIYIYIKKCVFVYKEKWEKCEISLLTPCIHYITLHTQHIECLSLSLLQLLLQCTDLGLCVESRLSTRFTSFYSISSENAILEEKVNKFALTKGLICP